MERPLFFCTFLLFLSFYGNISAQDGEAPAGGWQPDSLEQAFLDGKYFIPSFIRLRPGDDAFIFVDSEYVATVVKDPAVRGLYMSAETLTPEGCEAYYEKIISALPAEDIRVHQRLWKLKEVRRQVAGSGGIYTLATWITARPDAQKPYYELEVRRNYYDRFGICLGISFVRIRGNCIRVMELRSGKYYPLPVWRMKTRRD